MTLPTKQEIYGLLGVFEIACTHGDMAAQFKTKGELLDALASVFAGLERAERDAKRYRWLRDESQPHDWHAINGLNDTRWDEWDKYIDAALAAQEQKPSVPAPPVALDDSA